MTDEYLLLLADTQKGYDGGNNKYLHFKFAQFGQKNG